MTTPDNGIQYEHARFRSGREVRVGESIRSKYPQHKLAGKYVRACIGKYYPNLEQLEGIDHNTEVPCFYDGDVYYVPEEFVTAT